MPKKKNKIKIDDELIVDDNITLDVDLKESSKNSYQDEVVKEIESIKTHRVRINYVEDNAIVINLSGWAKRVYFDLSFGELDYIRCNKKKYNNKLLKLLYIGDINKPFEVKILPIKSLDDIGNPY